jgi:phosphate transport system substrate-binding protein
MKAYTFLLLILTLLLGILLGCATASNTPDQEEEVTITVSGAFALFPLMTVWAETYSQQNPNVRFDVQAGGAGKGMTDMLTGAADIAMLSREPRPEELDQGSYLVPVTIDAVIGTVNANNPHLAALQQRGVTPEDLYNVWISGESRTWDDLLGNGSSDPLNVYTRSDSSGAAEMWSLFVLGETQEDLRGTAVNADPGLAEAVRQDTLALGYNNVGFAYDHTTGAPLAGLAIIPLDLNGNGQIDPAEDFYGDRDSLTQAVADGTYPMPPARVLYLVTKGEPNPVIADFYRWVLTEGQAYVASAGYVPLSPARIEEALGLLSNP